MKPFILPFVAGLMLFTQVNACAQSADTSEKISQVESNLVGAAQTEGEVPGTIKDRMAHFHVNGLSIAVIHNYKIEWAKGYGFADFDRKTPVTDQTLFQAASISKSLNAIGVLKLVQDKKLDLYADINNYLHSSAQNTDSYSLIHASELNWKFPYDSLSKNRKISMANLLSHTAGLSVHGFGGYEKGSDIPNIVQVLDGKAPANSKPVRSMYPPGIKYEYSGGGITISQLIVTNVTQQPYEKYMYENVLKPLDMTSSTYTQFPTGVMKSLLAAAYDAKGVEITGKHHIYPEQAAAGLWTNPTDLAKYVIETQLSLQGKSNKILSQQMTKTMLTPYADKQAALGVFVENLDSTKYFGHGGANEGFRSQYYGSFDGGNGVVVMVNSDNGEIIPEIVNSVAKVYGFKGLYRSKVVKPISIALTEKDLQSYTGKYQLAPDFILAITREGDKLYGKVPGKNKLILFPETESKFYINLEDIEIEFIKDDKGEVVKAMVYENGPHDAKKMQ